MVYVLTNKLGARPLDGRVFFDSWEVADDIRFARASRILRYFCVKPVNSLFTGSRMKGTISPAQNLHFVDSSQPRNYLVSTLFKPSYVHSSASTDSHSVASTSCASSYECAYMPRPTPPPPQQNATAV